MHNPWGCRFSYDVYIISYMKIDANKDGLHEAILGLFNNAFCMDMVDNPSNRRKPLLGRRSSNFASFIRFRLGHDS